jgi:hypothetical protein
MKKIDIKVFFQKNKSEDCGPVCTQMVLHHFGIVRKLKEITSGMSYVPGGTYMFDNGLSSLKEGLNVELITANPLLFSQEVRNDLKNKDSLTLFLKRMEKKNTKLEKPLSLFRDFIANGGKTKIEIPTFKHIYKALDANKLIIALIYGRALGKAEGEFHFVVVSGYKKGLIYINNPRRGSRQGWFREDDFLYALHSTTCVDVDNGSLLVVGN